ncbi:ATP-binding cassette domain-containing protein [Parabacteroides bouchesdurhonensis]|uniref:ATP-binding cassette domain-containing protein n=1 Tax=Parabacteroides bouchesdurhonensis TaxID=1936995 RepID=UPI000C838F47|nr:ATP-binding cassette domain-containing protein [Parabacteroides bouchesdurhonensis]
MNETILNGLLNLFAIFASLARIGTEQARKAVNTYLSSHFGIRSHKEYIELYEELQSMYNDPDFDINKESVIINVCTQLKPKLITEEQLLLLLRFMEFAHSNSEGFNENLSIFQKIATIFNIEPYIYDTLLAFVTGSSSPSILTISGETSNKDKHIQRKGLDGEIRVLLLQNFDRLIFTYYGTSQVFMNDIPLTTGIFYSWQRSSVIKSPLFLPIYYSDVQETFNRNKHKERILLTGRNIDFYFKNSESGLHNFSFNLESGQLVAIMGGSGVGKSTLLSILNGNIIPQKGSICLNGHSLTEEECKRLIGFVPQDDLLIEELTVYQNLWYTAKLCFANLSDKEIEAKVKSILNDLDLLKICSLAVGSPIRKTISGGQRKRLNIALELIREPAILYLDEPTSGLSSSDSEKVMMLLKEQTHRGRLVVVNIHQPSSEIYKLFDRLWLLDTGGFPIYDGNPIEAITYFKRVANYTDQDISVCSTCGNVNPELILNIVDAKKIDDTGNQTNIRKLTAKEWHELYLSSRPEFKEPQVLPLPPNNQQKPSVWKQFLIFLERNIKTKLTNKQYLGIALLEAPLLAIIVALLTRYEPDEGYSLLTNKNLVSYIFMSVIVATFIGMSISAEEIIKDKTLLKRERFLRLSRPSYLVSKMFYLFCISALQSLLFIVVGNSIIGIGWEMFFIWWIVLWATSFLANLTGLLLSQTLSSIVAIYITIPLLLIPQILLCGLVVKFDDLSKQAANRNIVPLIGEIIPSRWAFEALTVEQFCNNAYNKQLFPIEKEKFLAQYYQNIHLPEVRSLVQQIALSDNDKQDKIKTIENELPVLSHAAQIEPYSSGENYEDYLNKVEKALHTRSDNYTALLNKTQKDIINKNGSEWFTNLKKEHHNTAIEELVSGTSETRFYKVANHRIYPKIGQIYMNPDNNWGRAPFYSHEKKVAGYQFSTFSFNLLMLGLFGLLVIISIFAEFPGRYINRNNE